MKISTVLGLLTTAAGVIAAPADDKTLAARRKAHFGGPMNKNRHAELSSNTVQSPWGGAVQEGSGWRTVTGTTVIPSVTGQSSSAGAAGWVGIDGMLR